jgi:hypothetical protein
VTRPASPAGIPSVRAPGVLGPSLDPGVLGGFLAPFAGRLRGDLHHGAGDRGPQAARGQLAGPVQHQGLGGAGLLGVEGAGGVGDDPGLADPQGAVGERGLGAGQLDFQVPGQVQQPGGAAAGFGQRQGQLVPGELIPGRRHLRLALERAARVRAAADQLGDGGVLAGGHVSLGPVPGADRPDQLIVAGAGVPVAGPGRVGGEPGQLTGLAARCRSTSPRVIDHHLSD